MNKLLLKDILDNKGDFPLASHMITIIDNSETNSGLLLKTIVSSHLKAATKVHYLTTTVNCVNIVSAFREEQIQYLRMYDCFSDPCGWNESGGVNLESNLLDIFSELGPKEKNVIVINRLDDVARHQKHQTILMALHQLNQRPEVCSLIIRCSSNLTNTGLLTAVQYLSGIQVTLKSSLENSCEMLVRKLSGKILKSHEQFKITMGIIHDIRSVVVVDERRENEDALIAQTTFNLSLTTNQRMAKNKLVLPYTRVQSTGGQIHYTPDTADDWDEEDPDDDLNI